MIGSKSNRKPQSQKKHAPAAPNGTGLSKPQAKVQEADASQQKGRALGKSMRRKKASRRANETSADRGGSKAATILELLKRPGGTTLDALMKVTGCQGHSVRGFLSGTVRKKMGLSLASNKSEGKDRVYSITQN